MPLFWSIINTNIDMVSLKPYTLTGFEPRSSVSEADAMSTAPRRRGHRMTLCGLRPSSSGFGPGGQGCQMVCFQTKYSNFGGSCIGRWWKILWTLGSDYGLMGYFMTTWYILCSLGTFFPGLVFCT
jgi:hypothetical protein